MGSCGTMNGDQIACNGFHIIRPHTALRLARSTLSSTWFDVRVFYVRVTNDLIDDSAPEFLKLNHSPLDPETLLEVNGKSCSIDSGGIPCLLRRDRVDKKSEEVTFVSTDAVKFTGSVKFEVFNGDNLVLRGVLEESEKKWSLRCSSQVVGCTSFLKAGPENVMPVIEVYTAGSVSGAPVILTETLQLNTLKKKTKRAFDAIPGHETEKTWLKNAELDLQQATEYKSYKMEGEEDVELLLSWFNAGVRVGVGIGLGVCLGFGLSFGLLLRTYQTTNRSFRRRLL